MRKLLIANRGEIALRVIRTAREMGVRTVAVYSDADAHALHTVWADEAVHLGGPEPAESYLDIDKIVRACLATGADAVHPGYGFLSERAEFAEALRKAGLTFVGPSPEAMRRLGAKIDAKQLAVANGVPVTPGFFEAGATAERLKAAADEIGYPVMLKASAGGGGRGMRVVRDPAELIDQARLAAEEAAKAFGDGAMMVEKLIDRPRHIEVQVLADAHGQVACLFERECSLQRRHQKIVEESPSPAMTDELWARMREAATRLVRAAGYTGAGTVEFMVDAEAGTFYFLEVNARLQVEHPVTEAVTGLDLVREQIRIARGERMELSPALMAGDRAAITGHAIEARIVAEDPARGFLPSVGKIRGWAEPKGPGIRFDTGYGPNAEVSRYYDSLLAKVIVHADGRTTAVDRLDRALQETHILGVSTNVPYLLDLVRHPAFGAGAFDTGFLAREFAEWSPGDGVPPELHAILAAATNTARSDGDGAPEAARETAWTGDGFRNARG